SGDGRDRRGVHPLDRLPRAARPADGAERRSARGVAATPTLRERSTKGSTLTTKLLMRNGVPFGERSPLSSLIECDPFAPGIQVARFSDPELEHHYKDKSLEVAAHVARRVR